MKYFVVFLFVVFALAAQAQNMPDSVIAKINGSPVLLDEFYRIKQKNSNVKSNDTLSINDYAELFINYKLKLLEAVETGIDTTEKFNNEFDKYTRQIADPFIFKESIKEDILQEAYERLKYDIKVGLIFVRAKKQASAEDSVASYQKALKIRNRLIGGEDFSKVAKGTSDDPSVEYNGGILGYITALYLPYAVENAVYSLKPGQISEPIHDNNGFFIAKVFDKRKSKGEVKTSQIMLITNPNDPASDKQVKETIDSVYDMLKAGGDFKELSGAYSTEPNTQKYKGALPLFNNTARFPQEFKEVAFNLEPGKFSAPFKTKYGWHIILLEKKQSLAPFEEQKAQLQDIISQNDNRSNISTERVLDNLKKEYKVSLNYKTLRTFANKVDETIFSGSWSIPADSSFSGVLFNIKGKKYMESDFAQWIVNNQKATSSKKYDKNVYISVIFDKYINQELQKTARKELFKNDTSYRNVVMDYYNGMLIFEISDKEVWSKANSDSAGIATYFNANRQKYMWDERVKVNIYTCKDSTVTEDLQKALAKKHKKNTSSEDLLKAINKKDPQRVTLQTKIYSKGDNEMIDSYEWKTGSVVWKNNSTAIEYVEIIPPTTKQITECRGMVIADYQKVVEQNWIQQLRTKYNIEINNDLLKKVNEAH